MVASNVFIAHINDVSNEAPIASFFHVLVTP